MNSRHCPDAAWPTVWACGLTFAAGIAATATLTHGFEHWTFEALRLARAERGGLRAPPTAVRTSRGDVVTLFAGGAPRAIFVVDFIATRCAGVCRALGNEYAQMQQALDAAPSPGVHLVSLSFDIVHDGTAQLAAYGAQHRARPEHWTVAAPLDAQRNRHLLRQIGVVAIADGWGGYLHNGDIHLIDSDGVVRGIHSFARWPTALAAARGLVAVAP